MGECYISIDLEAVRQNYRLLAAKVGGAKHCAAVVKANAYGLGLKPVSQALWQAGCREFFTATLAEGEILRGVLPKARVFVLHGFSGGEDIKHFVDLSLTPVLNSLEDITVWARHSERAPIALEACLHVDTGIHRLGVVPAEITTAAQRLGPFADRICLVMSHLACADEPQHDLNHQQRQRFAAALQDLPLSRARHSLAASAGIFLGKDYLYDLSRPGVALYGVAPRPDLQGVMHPVMRYQAKILQTQAVDAGETVGYSATHRFTAPVRLATVGAGYADGLLRTLSNRGYVMHRGFRLPFVGRVSMDLIILDITHAPEDILVPGDLVDLVGPDNPIEFLADAAGTLGYEILTRLPARHPRRYLNELPEPAIMAELR